MKIGSEFFFQIFPKITPKIFFVLKTVFIGQKHFWRGFFHEKLRFLIYFIYLRGTFIFFFILVMSSSSESSDGENANRRARIFRIRPIISDSMEFKQRFRLTRRLVDRLLNLLGPDLQPSTYRSNSLSALEKVLCALRFYASNSFNYTVGDAQG